MTTEELKVSLLEIEANLMTHKPFKPEDTYYRGQWDVVQYLLELIDHKESLDSN